MGRLGPVATFLNEVERCERSLADHPDGGSVMTGDVGGRLPHHFRCALLDSLKDDGVRSWAVPAARDKVIFAFTRRSSARRSAGHNQRIGVMRGCRTKWDPSGLGLCLVLLLGGLAARFGLQANDALAGSARKPSLRVIAEVAFQMRDSLMGLDVMVNGQGPFLFGWDTGASDTHRRTIATTRDLP